MTVSRPATTAPRKAERSLKSKLYCTPSSKAVRVHPDLCHRWHDKLQRVQKIIDRDGRYSCFLYMVVMRTCIKVGKSENLTRIYDHIAKYGHAIEEIHGFFMPHDSSEVDPDSNNFLIRENEKRMLDAIDACRASNGTQMFKRVRGTKALVKELFKTETPKRKAALKEVVFQIMREFEEELPQKIAVATVT